VKRATPTATTGTVLTGRGNPAHRHASAGLSVLTLTGRAALGSVTRSTGGRGILLLTGTGTSATAGTFVLATGGHRGAPGAATTTALRGMASSDRPAVSSSSGVLA
jgi:hypothetical protein